MVICGGKWETFFEGGGAMFIGEYNHSIDDKGRVTMPVKFREALGQVFYITRGLDNCLAIYSESEWIRFQENLNSNRQAKKDFRKIQRFFMSAAYECTLDKQGRLLISQTLRDYANIDKDVTVIGVTNRLEIWDQETWNQYINNDDLDISELTENMEDLNI